MATGAGTVHAPGDEARLDIPPLAGGDGYATVREQLLLESLLAHKQDLPDAWVVST